MTTGPLTWGIVLAGGSGARFGAQKQFDDLDGLSLLERSVAAAATVCTDLVIVVPDPEAVPAPIRRGVAVRCTSHRFVAGGTDRGGSVRQALAVIPSQVEVIVVADAAHPLASADLFRAVTHAVQTPHHGQQVDGAFPALAITEAIAAMGPDDVRGGSLPREGHVLVQTPQAFRAAVLRRAHAQPSREVEDSAMVAALPPEDGSVTRPRVIALAGDPGNLHVTTPAELDLARLVLRGRRALDR